MNNKKERITYSTYKHTVRSKRRRRRQQKQQQQQQQQ